MPDYHITVTEQPTQADLDTIGAQTRRHLIKHLAVLDTLPYREFTLALRDATGGISGGALAYSVNGWLFLDTLWVDTNQRGKGLGRLLLAHTEQAGLARGFHDMYLMTSSFQALPFYQRQGYTLFGQNAERPRGHTLYYVQKRNLQPQTVSGSVEIHEPNDPEVYQRIEDGLKDHAAAYAPLTYRRLAVLVHDDAGQLVGGIAGGLWWDWFDAFHVWLTPELQQAGIAAHALDLLTREAAERGIYGMVCDTAVPSLYDFYMSVGFERFASLPDHPPGHTGYFLQKRFRA